MHRWQRSCSHERRTPIFGLLALLAALLCGCQPASEPSTGKAAQGDAASCASAHDAEGTAATASAAAKKAPNDIEALKIAEALKEPSSGCGLEGVCDELQENARLGPGEWLSSPNGEYVAILRDSNFKILTSSIPSAPIWEAYPGDSSPKPLTAARVINSQLVLESADRRIWSSPTKNLQLRITFMRTFGGGTHVQLAEVVFWSQGKALDLEAAEASSPHADKYPVRHAVDGNASTKFSAVAGGGRAELLIVLPRIVDIDQVSFVTANSAPDFDPVRWRLEFSEDGKKWFPMHDQREDFAMPRERKAETKRLNLTTHWHRWSAMRTTSNKVTKIVLSDGGMLMLKLDKQTTWSSKKQVDAPPPLFQRRQEDPDTLEWRLQNGSRTCSKALTCFDCVIANERPRTEKGFCTWCLAARTCAYTLSSKEYVCRYGFPQDHVSNSKNLYGAGICPKLEDVEEQHRHRHERDAEAVAAAAAERAEAESSTADNGTSSAPGEYDPKLVQELLQRGKLADEDTGATHPYAVLKVRKSASGSQIRKAYRKQSMLFHPDKWEQAKEEWRTAADKAFKDISLAYETVGTPDKRAEFDKYKGKRGKEFDKHWKDWSVKQWKGDEDFYFGDELITTLTEEIWEQRLQGSSIWLVEFYVAWCGPCRLNRNKWRQVAKTVEDLPVEVGAVNCMKQERICNDYVGIHQYPSVRILNRENGAMASYIFKYQDVAAQFLEIPAWVDSVVSKWEWLFDHARVHWNLSPADFEPDDSNATVGGSTDMWIVTFLDGHECPTCKAASTNLLRLSATMLKEGLPVAVGSVDCSLRENHKFCYKVHGIPSPPHRPVTKAWRAGSKSSDGILGEVLYGPADVDPHVAFPILERTARLALGGRHDSRNERAAVQWSDTSPPNSLKQDLDKIAGRMSKPSPVDEKDNIEDIKDLIHKQ